MANSSTTNHGSLLAYAVLDGAARNALKLPTLTLSVAHSPPRMARALAHTIAFLTERYLLTCRNAGIDGGEHILDSVCAEHLYVSTASAEQTLVSLPNDDSGDRADAAAAGNTTKLPTQNLTDSNPYALTLNEASSPSTYRITLPCEGPHANAVPTSLRDFSHHAKAVSSVSSVEAVSLGPVSCAQFAMADVLPERVTTRHIVPVSVSPIAKIPATKDGQSTSINSSAKGVNETRDHVSPKKALTAVSNPRSVGSTIYVDNPMAAADLGPRIRSFLRAPTTDLMRVSTRIVRKALGLEGACRCPALDARIEATFAATRLLPHILASGPGCTSTDDLARVYPVAAREWGPEVREEVSVLIKEIRAEEAHGTRTVAEPSPAAHENIMALSQLENEELVDVQPLQNSITALYKDVTQESEESTSVSQLNDEYDSPVNENPDIRRTRGSATEIDNRADQAHSKMNPISKDAIGRATASSASSTASSSRYTWAAVLESEPQREMSKLNLNLGRAKRSLSTDDDDDDEFANCFMRRRRVKYNSFATDS